MKKFEGNGRLVVPELSFYVGYENYVRIVFHVGCLCPLSLVATYPNNTHFRCTHIHGSHSFEVGSECLWIGLFTQAWWRVGDSGLLAWAWSLGGDSGTVVGPGLVRSG